MLVKLDDLKGVANNVGKELKCLRYLKERFQSELGFRACGKTLHKLAEHVNDALDERQIIGESDYIHVKTSVLIECLKNDSIEVRRMAARLLPERIADKVIFTNNDVSVIYAAAGRASCNALAKLLEQNRSDELLFDIAKERLNEDVDLEKAKRLSQIVSYGPSIDIDDFWYVMTAKKLIDQFAHPTDGGRWISSVAKKTVGDMKATSGIEIDEEKLRKEILSQLDESDDKYLETMCEVSDVFSQMIDNLSVNEIMSETFNVNFLNESSDQLLEVSDNVKYIEKFESEYKVRYFNVPKSMFMRNGLDEVMTKSSNVSIPGIAYTPHMRAPTERDERALDRYVSNWTKRVFSNMSENLRLKWSMNVEHEGKLSFNIGVM